LYLNRKNYSIILK